MAIIKRIRMKTRRATFREISPQRGNVDAGNRKAQSKKQPLTEWEPRYNELRYATA